MRKIGTTVRSSRRAADSLAFIRREPQIGRRWKLRLVQSGLRRILSALLLGRGLLIFLRNQLRVNRLNGLSRLIWGGLIWCRLGAGAVVVRAGDGLFRRRQMHAA